MEFERILIVDDDDTFRRLIVMKLQPRGVPVLGVSNVKQALEELQNDPPDLLVTDLQLPDGDGLELLHFVRRNNLACDVIIMTGFGSIQTAVEAMKSGAANYLVKPFSMSHFDLALAMVLDQRKLRRENSYLRERLDEYHHTGILHQSPEMRRVQELIARISPTDATVLIHGESGTGKELVAREIHENSLRRSRPYVKLNCAAVPDNLLESEFFGHERGAFTGANARRIGRFELANGGTLLLDEVTEIGLPLQAKLLRALQEREIERVGGNRIIKVDVRIIATTNRDLKEAVEARIFREDLYYRLNVVPVHVPPLRDRRGDTEYLLRAFLKMFAEKHGKPMPPINVLTMAQLCEYSWPGNVRELRNFAERAIILSEPGRELNISDHALSRTAGVADSAFLTSSSGEFPSLAEVERRLIMLALKKTGGQRNEAARLLGINVRTLRNKLHEYADQGLDVNDPGAPQAASALN
ncbi:hypothetical protein DB346_14135 [Verrucomicrobia bacterium LW23]|nr:hypothetical protein DB346_14135 [Verrucomicrobia bacterium LW23]